MYKHHAAQPRALPKPLRLLGVIVLLLLFPCVTEAAPRGEVIHVSLSRTKVQRGETIEFGLQALKEGVPANEAVRVVLLRPSAGTENLPLRAVAGSPGAFVGEIHLDANAPEGIHVLHAWTGEMARPSAVGKATFLLGKLVNDFFVASYLDQKQPAKDLKGYLKDFRGLGGNFLIAHGLITPAKAFYPSKIARTDVERGSENDIVELVLSRADRDGLAVLLSVSWDMTKNSHYKDRMGEIKALMDEMYALYRHHPSLAGFYSYQEGSGTYYASYVREFSAHVKSLGARLLSACAPHIDDPLLAGYLSTVEELDLIIYQAGVMASYRTDNRKLYPPRRVRDFCALGAGAARLQDKIAITHVELFAYLEKKQSPEIIAARYEDIYQQILSAASVTGANGISLFSYHAHIHAPLKKYKEVGRSREAVSEGLKAFSLVTSEISKEPDRLALYFPYSDWVVERWPNYFLPALDAFRVLGIPVDILPYAPPLEEAVYPYYPIHMNEEVLRRLLREQSVLVLPNVSGFQQTDSDLMKSFVEQGGVLVAFGPQIPMGRSYERRELFGGEEVQEERARAALVVKEALGSRVRAGSRFPLHGVRLPSWRTEGARLIAAFDDGSAAILSNRFGKGTVIAILPDALTVARAAPELVRDIIGHALAAAGRGPLVDIRGLNERTDVAVGKSPGGFRVALVNHNEYELEVTLRPLGLSAGHLYGWIDMNSSHRVGASARDHALRLAVPGRGFRAVEFRK